MENQTYNRGYQNPPPQTNKFYEGKVGMGILYLFTVGLFGISTLVDFIMLLFKPNPYYV